jgi:tetratricopeptide (TPR) repeat protein
VRFKKINYLICLAEFKLGKLIFPALEPILRLLENKDPEVRGYFNQAIFSTNEKKQAIALLNLNMVLSLNPRHFLARVFRGRIYIKEGQYRLASEDYLEANKISQYRFIHYDLYREYFRSVNSKLGLVEDAIVKNFDQVFGAPLNQKDGNSRYGSADMGKQVKKMLAMMEAGSNEEKEIISRNFVLSPDETKKFMIMGPITEEEVEGTDWDQLADDLTL